MNDEDRRKLQTSRSFLVKNIENIEDINEELYTREVFTDGMKADVEVQDTKEKKVRKFLDILPRRGPDAFEIFLDVLNQTKNKHVYDRLITGSSGATYQRSYIAQPVNLPTIGGDNQLPETWPDERSILEASQCKIKPHDPSLMQHTVSGRAYQMKRNPRGRAVIINNKIFHGPVQKIDGKNRVMLAMREGTDEDVQGLHKLFTDLHFHVKIHKDKNAQKIVDILQEEANDAQFHRHADCFILIILTHGKQNAIYGSDGKTVEIRDIKDMFNARNFPCMEQKPKLFFIQACRGEEYDGGRNKTVPDASSTDCAMSGNVINLALERTRLEFDKVSIEKANDTDAMVEKSVATDSHRLVAMATTMDMVSFRNRILGSWFMQAVIYVFRKCSHNEDILSMLSDVNHLVSLGRAKDRENRDAVAVSEFESTLSKRFYFFPHQCETVPIQASTS